MWTSECDRNSSPFYEADIVLKLQKHGKRALFNVPFCVHFMVCELLSCHGGELNVARSGAKWDLKGEDSREAHNEIRMRFEM